MHVAPRKHVFKIYSNPGDNFSDLLNHFEGMFVATELKECFLVVNG